MKPQKFMKRPVEVEAMLLRAETNETDFLDPNTRALAEISGWMKLHGFHHFKIHGAKRPHGILIATLEGDMIAKPGDYVIRGVQGEFYPCAPDIFEATYEAVDEP